MPELGETWSVMESDGDRGRLEAVIIATGPTMIRLVTRSGRRITFPTGRWGITWTLVHPCPVEPQTCSSCRQTAFFRHTVGGETLWVCEDHVPHGARAYFPGDTPGPPGLGLTCPRCESTRVDVDPGLIALSGGRTTTKAACNDCRSSWSPLVGRGLGDDGTILAGDLGRIIEEDSSVSEVWLGFIAYRNLCRAVGMGDVAHIHGVSTQEKPGLADVLTYVFFTSSEAAAAAVPPTRPIISADQRLPSFGLQFPARDIPIGSVWKRRSLAKDRDVLCRVISDNNNHHVTFRVNTQRIEDARPAATLSVADFCLYWTPNTPLTGPPRAWTIWQHLETEQLVQVTSGTPTQTANNQASYVTPDGKRETTPIVTFYRLYRELPTPPEGHVWHRQGELFTAQVTGDLVAVHPYAVHEEPLVPHTVTPVVFYGLYKPLVFEDELCVQPDFEDELCVQPPVPTVLQRDARWTLKADPNYAAFIVDIGRVSDGTDYVRYNNSDGLHTKELQAFLTLFELPPRFIPCEVGETWVDLETSKREALIDRIDPARGKVLLRWESGALTTLSLEQLTAGYRKLDVRSYWEMLESADEP